MACSCCSRIRRKYDARGDSGATDEEGGCDVALGGMGGVCALGGWSACSCRSWDAKVGVAVVITSVDVIVEMDESEIAVVVLL
jgi:hypothetical protein